MYSKYHSDKKAEEMESSNSPAPETCVPQINTLDDLISEIKKIFEKDDVDIDYVKYVLESYKSNPKDWKRFAIFDQHRYTRNLVDTGNGKYNLMTLCWGEGHGSSIHDHSGSHCFVKMLDGCLKETLFEWPAHPEKDEPLKLKAETTYEKNGVTYMSDELGLHRMENPSQSNRAVSLHLYIPPFKTCKTFDERTGHENTVKVTFWSRYGKREKFGVDRPRVEPAENN